METNRPPSRLERRHYIVNDYPEKGILELCEYWHGQINGSFGISITDEDLITAKKFLLTCLETWQPSCRDEDTDFDGIVKKLIEVTLKEIYKCQEGRMSKG